MSFDRIIFEYPTGWLAPGSDPLSGQHLQCFETIKLAADQLGLGFSTRNSLRMADFAPRIAPDNALLISVHTVGIARNVVRLKESYLPGFYYFDRTGYSGWAEIAYNQDLQNQAISYSSDDNAEFLMKIRDDKLSSNSSKYPQNPAAAGASRVSEKPYVFLALQTTDDFVARLAYIDQVQLAFLLAKKAHEQSMQLVVKRHPLCSDRYIEESISRLAGEYNCVTLTDESVNVLIPDAKVVATVNSGVGFEALIMGVPVITAGRSDFSFVTAQLLSEHDLRQFEVFENKSRCSTVENFLCYYLKNYCLHYSDIENAKSLIQRWGAEQYSSMHDILNWNCTLLDDTQLYMAELEKMRRCNLLKLNDICSSDDVAKKTIRGMGALNRIRAFGQRIFS
jgi:hypothetical protein